MGALRRYRQNREKRLELYRKADELRAQIKTEAETKFDKQKVAAIVAEYENGFDPKSGKAKAVIALEKVVRSIKNSLEKVVILILLKKLKNRSPSDEKSGNSVRFVIE